MRRTTVHARVPRSAAALALLVLLGSACSGDDERDRPGLEPEPEQDGELRQASKAPTTGPTTPSADRGEGDQVAADEVVLNYVDLGPEWGEDFPGPADPSRPERLTDLAACLGSDLITHQDVVARSQRFDAREIGHVAATVIFTPSTEAAGRLMKAVHSPGMPTCFGTVIAAQLAAEHAMMERTGLPNTATPGEPRPSPLEFPPMGDDTAATRVVTPRTYDDPSGRHRPATVDLFTDAVFVREGRVVIAAMFSSTVSEPFDSTLAEEMVQRMVGRVPPEAASD